MTSLKAINRKVLDTFGKRGKRAYVRVFRETVGRRDLVRVQWRESGKLLTESFDDSRKGISEAKAFAHGKHEALLDQPAKGGAPAATTVEPLTLRQLRDRYVAAFAHEWEPATLASKTARWKSLELTLGRNTLAADVTPDQLDKAVTTLLTSPVAAAKGTKRKRSANQVQAILATFTATYRWAVDRGHLAPSKVMTYHPKLKQALKKQVVQTAEYSATERAAMIAALDPRKSSEWRAWVLTVLFAHCGPRQRASRYLEVDDIELAAPVWVNGAPTYSGRIRWRADTDKMDNERFQPMPSPVAEAFWVAFAWRVFDEYTGRFVFYGAQRRTRGQALRRNTRRSKSKESIEGLEVDEKPYTYPALNETIRRAETKAGIAHIDFRSTHGHRRGVSGDIHTETGSSKKAADWIGDKSTKIVEKHYLLQRQENLDEAAQLATTALDAANVTPAPAGASTKPNRNKTQQPRTTGGVGSLNP